MHSCAWCHQQFNEGDVSSEGICSDGRGHKLPHREIRRNVTAAVVEDVAPIEVGQVFDEDDEDSTVYEETKVKPRRTIRQLNEELAAVPVSDVNPAAVSELKEINKARRKFKQHELGPVEIMNLVRQRVERQNAAKQRKQERLATQQLGVTEQEQAEFIEALQ